MAKKIERIEGKAPPPRNPVAASLVAFRSTTERKRKGRGSYRRGERITDDGASSWFP